MNLNISINKKDLKVCKDIIDCFATWLLDCTDNSKTKQEIITATDILYKYFKLKDAE